MNVAFYLILFLPVLFERIQNDIFIFIPRISLSVAIPKFITHISEHDLKCTVQLLKGRNQAHFFLLTLKLYNGI
jgi:hypothetical protein